jgi:hypothetical protein
MEKTTKSRSLAAWFALLVGGLFAGPASAQEFFEPTIHWAYASFFGTGWYKINDERSGYVLRVTPRWAIGESELHEDGKRDIEYTLRVPLTIGVARLDFEDIPGILDPDNFNTASVNMSLDADIPISRRFSVRPSAELGYATILDESDYAWTYRLDVKTRTQFEAGDLDWAFMFDIGLVGYEPNRGDSDDFTFAAAGLEFGYPIGWFSTDDSQTMIYWHIAYTDFIDEVEFQTGITEFDSVANFWQGGIAFGRRDQPVNIWRLKFDRLGLAYNYSATGDLRGVKFVFRSLYEL